MTRQGTRGHRREPEGIRRSLLCGGVVQLVRTPACHAGGRGSSPVAPAISFPNLRRVSWTFKWQPPLKGDSTFYGALTSAQPLRFVSRTTFGSIPKYC